MTNLSEQDREALQDAQIGWIQRQDNRTWLSHIAPVVADIVRRAQEADRVKHESEVASLRKDWHTMKTLMADALNERTAVLESQAEMLRKAMALGWDEGHSHRCGDGDWFCTNPHAPADDAQEAAEGTSSGLAGLGDAGDGVRGGGA